MKNIFMEKKFLEYRLNDFLVSFQLWICETIPAIARKNYCIKHESQRPQMLSWSSNQHVTSLEVNQIVPFEAEKGEEYVVGLFVEGLGGDQDDDNFEHPVVDLELRMQSNPIENRLKDVEERIKTNEEVMESLQILECKVVMERLQILECKVEKMLASNEGQMKDGVESLLDETDQVLAGNEEEMKDGVESLPDETNQVYNDISSFSLGIEFELSCGEKDVEVPVRKSDKSVEKSDKAVEKSLRAEVKSGRKLWKSRLQAETEIEDGNVEIIDIDDETLDMHLKRQKKPRVLLQSPWVNEFDSTSGTKKRVVKGTFAFAVGVGPLMACDVDAFELWFNKGLVKKNK
ncbi:Hypothetical predicted protein [Olea europaea subsp. europaea]|uniref:Uncharacterized protein n=1 Tax=Olea europaea subsp. europaea TaxID=158383 RepID=A0A8S0Q9F4_OLEEU|nr:Hypothetical predicted protein [Olea europaea subsp. europaea]